MAKCLAGDKASPQRSNNIWKPGGFKKVFIHRGVYFSKANL